MSDFCANHTFVILFSYFRKKNIEIYELWAIIICGDWYMSK